jgi:hypothetical protein
MPGSDSPVLLGVRHHGPGSARAVRRALESYRPAVVLVEGPPEADALVGLAAAEGMRPPVALLAYAPPGRPAGPPPPAGRRDVVFWPFAEFSPEWQAIQWCLAAGVPVRFCDLPTAYRFGRPGRVAADPSPNDPSRGDPSRGDPSRGDPGPDEPEADEPDPDGGADGRGVRDDPIGALARSGGYDDPERWWEDVVEHRRDPDGTPEVDRALAPFEAIAEAMAVVRGAAGPAPGAEQREEERREAYMRTVLRAALKEHGRVAVVCGAWHVPALAPPWPPARADAAVLKGLARGRVALTWVPWTHGRLASWQGYGAGVSSPGWYHHLFTAPDRPVERWLVEVAGVLRTEGQPVSSAHVIEAARLAGTLATLRGRPLAGLAEVTDATLAVLCDGNDVRLALVDRRLVVGERLGTVPADTPSVPLVAAVAAAQRRLRMPPSPLAGDLDLDLRREIDLDRSRLLHRLRLLGVDWGEPVDGGRRGKGTFWESWRLRWRPEYAVDLIEAGGYGTTVAGAATARAAELAAGADSVSALTTVVEQCLLADLPEAHPTVLRALDARAALDTDVTHLMAAVPALARTVRYGDVRGSDVAAMRVVAHGLVVRVCAGLPAAVAGLDESAATELRTHLDAVQTSLALLDDSALTAEWLATLEGLAGQRALNGLLAGRLNRMLLDAGRLDPAEAGRRLGLVLTVGEEPARAAAWVEGFLAGGGLLLVHDERLLELVDSWLAGIAAEAFVEVLPLLRRTFAEFAGPERRAIGEQARHLDGGGPGRARPPDEIDHDRAAVVLPTLRLLLGRDVLLGGEPSEAPA